MTLDDGLLTLNTKDESEARRRQTLFSETTDPSTLPSPIRRFFDSRNVLFNALGQGEFEPRVGSFDTNRGDRFLLLSDGVSDNLTDTEIASILKDHINPDEAADTLVSAAKTRSKEKRPRSKPDDMTALVVEIPV